MFLEVLLVLLVCGLILWVAGQLPIDGTIYKLIKIVVVVYAVLFLVSVFFPGHGFDGVRFWRH